MPTKPPTTNHQLYHFTISLLASLGLYFFLVFTLKVPTTIDTTFTIYLLAFVHTIVYHVIHNSR